MEININIKDINKNNIIDIREKYIYNIKNIKGSINIPMNYILTNPDYYINKKNTYYIICEYGKKSKKVSEILNKIGYHTYSIKGGIKGII